MQKDTWLRLSGLYMLVQFKTYFFFMIPLILNLGGCSSLEIQDPVNSTVIISKADLLSGKALFGGKAQRLSLPEDDVLGLNERMLSYLENYVPRNYGEGAKVRNIMRMMIGQGLLGMEYNMSKTYTAWEAFQKAEGNCLSFSYLFAVFAKNRGLKVRFQEVEIPPQWDQVTDELYYFSRHVNVRIYMKEYHDIVVDIDRINFKPHYRVWQITDNNAVALYYSNKGTDYLHKNDYENAFRYLVKALQLAPRDAALWSNLGVLYRMKGLYNYAEKAYFIALKYDDKLRSALSNLSVLYDQMGEQEKSEYYFNLAKEHQLKNPYYRYYQALEAFEEGNYPLSLQHLKAALKYRDDVQKIHSLLGETYAKLGDEDRANQAWAKARELLDEK